MSNRAAIRLLHADDCCEDRQLLLDMFREIHEDTGVLLYAAPGAAGGATASLPELSFPEGKRGMYVYDMRDAAVMIAVDDLLGRCSEQGNVLGLDCEWEPSFGGAPPNPVATIQLSLPDGTAYCFQLHHGSKHTSASNFPPSLQSILEDVTIAKV